MEEECATAVTGDYHLTKICRFQIGCSGQVTLQESVLREMEAILEEEEEQFAIVVTGEFEAAGIGRFRKPAVMSYKLISRPGHIARECPEAEGGRGGGGGGGGNVCYRCDRFLFCHRCVAPINYFSGLRHNNKGLLWF